MVARCSWGGDWGFGSETLDIGLCTGKEGMVVHTTEMLMARAVVACSGWRTTAARELCCLRWWPWRTCACFSMTRERIGRASGIGQEGERTMVITTASL